MKQKIKKLFTHNASRVTYYERGGFTLIEIAIVLVVLGILIALGAALMGPLTKRVKYTDSREVVKQAKEALLGYAVKNGFFIADPLGSSGARKLDAWGRNILFYADDNIWGTTGKNVCGVTATNTRVKECTTDDCTGFNSKSNIAFIVYSTGEDANGVCTGTGVCTGGAGTCIFPTCTGTCTAGVCSGGAGTCPTCTATPGAYCTFPVWQQASGYNSPCTYTATNPAFQYDDIVQYVALDEIRSARGCSFTITNQTLPDTKTRVTYNVTLNGTGGTAPYTWSVSGQTAATYGCAANTYPLITGPFCNGGAGTCTGTCTGTCVGATCYGGAGTCAGTCTGQCTYSTGICLTSTGASAGLLSGTPTAANVYNFTVTLTDTNGVQTLKAFTLNVLVPCGFVGINVRNTTGGAIGYRENLGACTAWANNTTVNNLLPTDYLNVYTSSTCVTARCTTYPVRITYSLAEGIDVNTNCAIALTGIAATCAFSDE